LFISGSIPVLAQEELPNPGILPDNPFYSFKRFGESIRLWLTFDPEAKVKLRIRLAEMRLAELNATIAKGQYRYAERLRQEYENEINKTEDEMNRTKGLGRNVTALAEHVSNVTYKHVLILEGILEKVPEQAKLAIENAINASLKGHETAVIRLSESSPEKAAEFRVRFAENRLEKARIKAFEGKVRETEELVKEYEKEINESVNLIEKAESLGRNVTALAEHISNVTYKHVLILETNLPKVPEQAKPAIEHAANVSIKGHEKAVESILVEINKTIEEARKFNCTIDADCRLLLCPQVLGSDTPICEDGKCKCGGRWQVVNKTEWRERFGEELTNETQKIQERIRERVREEVTIHQKVAIGR
jgi:hypothetical protein